MPGGIFPAEQNFPEMELLRDYKQRLRAQEEQIQLGMIQLSCTAGSRVLAANQFLVRMLGYDSPADIAGMPAMDLFIRPQDCSELLDDLERDGSVYHRRLSLKRMDGLETWVLVQAWKITSAESTASIIEMLVEDITEHLVIEQEMHYHESELNRYALALAQANKKLNLLSSITRHDLLNKLTGLSGYLELMKGDFPDPKIQEYLAIQEKIIGSITAHVQFTRDYQDIGIKTPHWFCLQDSIESATATLALSSVFVTINTGNLQVYADPMLEKVFYNLIENSLRHGGTVSRIQFFVETGEDAARLIYADNGCGVPNEFKEDIFLRKHFKHTGFGLYLSREILGITGLSIIENGLPGGGARFEITIPQQNFRIGDGAT